MLLGPKFLGNIVLGKYEILSWEDWAYDIIPAWTATTFLFVCLYPNKNTHLSVAGQPIFISGHLCPFRSPNLMQSFSSTESEVKASFLGGKIQGGHISFYASAIRFFRGLIAHREQEKGAHRLLQPNSKIT